MILSCFQFIPIMPFFLFSYWRVTGLTRLYVWPYFLSSSFLPFPPRSTGRKQPSLVRFFASFKIVDVRFGLSFLGYGWWTHSMGIYAVLIMFYASLFNNQDRNNDVMFWKLLCDSYGSVLYEQVFLWNKKSVVFRCLYICVYICLVFYLWLLLANLHQS